MCGKENQMKARNNGLSIQETRNYHQQEAERVQKELDSLSSEFAEDGIVKTVLRDRIAWEKERVKAFSSSGPGSMFCDRAGPVTIEDCKTCWGTGGCRHGKTEEEWTALVEKMGAKEYIAVKKGRHG